MKYRIVVQKERPIRDDGNEMFRGRMHDGDFDDVFTADINADDAIELGQHLWDIANRKKNE